MIAARALYGQVTAPVTLTYGDHDWARIPELKRTSHCFVMPNQSPSTRADLVARPVQRRTEEG
jgi:hypothetical protein